MSKVLDKILSDRERYVCSVKTLGECGIPSPVRHHKYVADGERVVQVPRPYAETGYSALEGLAYLNMEDPADWPNVYMGRYFGADTIIGY